MNTKNITTKANATPEVCDDQRTPYPDAWFCKGKIVFRCEDGDFIAQAVSASAAQTFTNEHNRKAYDIAKREKAHAERLADACAKYVRARNDGGISMADLSSIADRAIREALAQWQNDKH